MFDRSIASFEAYTQTFLDQVQSSVSPKHAAMATLVESMSYSLNGGGKRVRPLLSLLTAEALGADQKLVLPWALSVEMIHTYSLIHDDLPIMDNDDERRGRPTNHKVFGETTALLAGDAWLTEAFLLLSSEYVLQPQVACEAVRLLSEAAGLRGMVGGQAIDLAASVKDGLSEEALWLCHRLKTGALIQVAVEGAAVVCGAEVSQRQALAAYGESLGLAFQLSDDLLDFDPEQAEASGFPDTLGVEKTQELLAEATNKAIASVQEFGERAQSLIQLAEYNQNRDK